MASIDLKKIKGKMHLTNKALQDKLANIRAGRANANLLNQVKVEYYGVPTPLNQIASIQVPEARTLLVAPYDKSSLKAIEQALFASNLGLTPQNNGSTIHLTIPQLTEDRRKELGKQVKKIGEQSKIAARNIRRDFMNEINKEKDISEDLQRKDEDKIQKETNKEIKEIDSIVSKKEKELMEI